VDEVLRLVQMERFAERKPNALSGGQQQRVALARALAVEPDCLLLDEPLSNLDAQLRQEMRGEIRRICKTAGFTTLYVTHDQKEALSVADRIAVLRDGQVAQVGTPAELYHRPRTAFVATFIGQTNLLPGEVVVRDGTGVRVRTPVGELLAAGSPPDARKELTVCIRPEQIRLATAEQAGTSTNRIVGRAVETTFLGEATEHVLEVNGTRLKVMRTPPLLDVPAELAVEVDAEDVVLL
jgi:iron(III) transport system ATP-binding protein